MQNVNFDLVTNSSITASFEPVEGLLDNYNISIIDPDDIDSILSYQIVTPTGNVVYLDNATTRALGRA